VNKVWRTTKTSYINIPLAYIPDVLRTLIVDPSLRDSNGNLRLGPIPEGTPINLLANTNLEAPPADIAALAAELVPALIDIDVNKLEGDQAKERFKKVVPLLLKVNKCPDFIEDKGHYFGTDLPDSDKRALIEFLKTL